MRSDSPVGFIAKGLQPAWAFDMQGTSPLWMSKAEELDRMARLGYAAWREDVEEIRAYRSDPTHKALPSRPTTVTVTLFLAATAIELLLKACLVVEHPECVSQGRLQGKAIESHDLLKIAREASVALEHDEADFCALGTEAIRSFGRYTIGKNASASPSGVAIKDGTFAVYDRLHRRLRERVEARPWRDYVSVQSNARKATPRGEE